MLATEAADPSAPLWLAVRAEIEGSRWYLYDAPLVVGPDGTMQLQVDGKGVALGAHLSDNLWVQPA